MKTTAARSTSGVSGWLIQQKPGHRLKNMVGNVGKFAALKVSFDCLFGGRKGKGIEKKSRKLGDTSFFGGLRFRMILQRTKLLKRFKAIKY